MFFSFLSLWLFLGNDIPVHTELVRDSGMKHAIEGFGRRERYLSIYAKRIKDYGGPQCQDTIFKFLSDTGASFLAWFSGL